MSLKQIAQRLEDASPKVVAPESRILIFDIERLPGHAIAQYRGLTIGGDFWDLNDWKDTIRRRIHPDEVKWYPSTICVAWQWYHKSKVEFAAEWMAGGRELMFDRIWQAFDQAEIVVGHNIKSFDIPKLKNDWGELGWMPPSPAKPVDTLTEARRFGYESRTLNALCQRLDIPAKTDRYDVEVARAACAGDKAAQRRIKAYNVGDIHATRELYDRLRPWMASHPHIGEIVEDVRRCPSCGSTDLKRNGTTRAVVIDYVLLRCSNCGANVKSTRHSRSAVTRGVR